MKLLIFGAGAMGSLIGGLLARRHEVTLVGRGPHVEAIRREGLRIRGRTELHVRPHAVEDVSEADPPDVVIVTVKSYDTAEAARALRRFRTRGAFLSLQNGLGNLDLLAEGSVRVLGGVTYHGVTFVGPGEVLHAGTGDTVLGPFRGATLEEAGVIAAAFREVGLATQVTGDVRTVVWTKAVVNACFNPLTGLLRVRSGVIGRSPPLMECAETIVAEAVAVAAAEGVSLDASALLERVADVSAATAENRSSMLQDLEKGRRTEIDAINGAITRLGVRHGIACPVNRLLTLLVKAAEEGGGPA